MALGNYFFDMFVGRLIPILQSNYYSLKMWRQETDSTDEVYTNTEYW